MDILKSHHARRVLQGAVIDGMILFVAYTLVFFARAITTPWDNYISGLGFTLVCVGITLVSLYLFRVYHRMWERTSGHDVAVIVYALVAATILEVGINMLVAMPQRPLPTSVIFLGNSLSLIGFVAVRYRARTVSGLSWRWRVVWRGELPKMMTRVLVVGAGESGSAFVWRLKHRWEQSDDNKHEVVGFIDDDPEKRGMIIDGCRVIGSRHDIPKIVEDRRVDLIVIAIHNISGPDLRELLAYCESTKARIKVVPDMYAMLNQRLGVATLRDVRPEDVLGRKLVGRHKDVDLTPIMGKVVLVTGAAGSIGSELCRQMASYEPVQLLLLDNNESGLHDLYIELGSQHPELNLVPVLADITQRDALELVFERYRPQIVFHAAAYKHVPMLELFPHESIRVNVGGTRNLGELARDYGAERFVLISTDKAVDPSCIMGASKRTAELLMHALFEQPGHNTLFTAVRFGNVLGSRGSVVPTFNRQIDKGGPITVTHKDMKRYFMTIAEAVNLVIHAAALTQGGELFMLRMGEEVRILDLAERMIRLRGLRPYEDIEIRFMGVRPGEKLNEKLQRDNETAIPTVHPHIVKLESHDESFDTGAFMSRVDQMVSEDTLQGSYEAVMEQTQAFVDDAAIGQQLRQKMYFDYLLKTIQQADVRAGATDPKSVTPEVVADDHRVHQTTHQNGRVSELVQ